MCIELYIYIHMYFYTGIHLRIEVSVHNVLKFPKTMFKFIYDNVLVFTHI